MEEKKYYIMSGAVLVVLALVAIWCAVGGRNEPTKIRFGEIEKITENWESNMDGIVELPKTFSNRKDQEIMLTHILDEDLPDGYGLMFHTGYCIYRVYLDDELIWSYGVEGKPAFGRMLGTIVAIVELPGGAPAGAKLVISLIPQYNLLLNPLDVTVGSVAQLKAQVLRDGVWRIVACALFGVLAAVAMFFGIVHYEHGLNFNSTAFLYLGLFALSIGVWLFCDSDLSQFITDANCTVALLNFMSLLLAASMYMAFCAQLFTEYKSLFHRLECVGYAMISLLLVFFVTGIADPPQLLIFVHIYLFAVTGVATVYMFIHMAGHRDTAIPGLLPANLVVLFTAIISMICFWLVRGSQYPAILCALGFFLFAIMLLRMLLRQEVKILKQGICASVYKEMAYHDGLTGLANRAAFEDDMDAVALQTAYKPEVLLFIFDLNGLKWTNDHIGHHAGDLLLKGAAQCMREVFEPKGKCYRLGGDEYAAILINPALTAGEYCDNLNRVVAKYNGKTPYKVSMAVGYATRLVDHEDDNFKRDFFQEADEAMYRDKERAHEQMRREGKSVR